MADIAEIHDKVLDNLLFFRKNSIPNLRFTLRQKPLERLKKGYWFLGNENYLAFSCWQGRDFKNKTPNIYFEMIPDGSAFLRLTAKDDVQKAKVLEFLAAALGGFSQIKEENGKGVLWTKTYPREPFPNSIIEFLNTDRPRISKLLELVYAEDQGQFPHGPGLDKSRGNPFPEIDETEFNTSLKRILNLRTYGKEEIDLNDPKYRSLYLVHGFLNQVGLFDFARISFGKRVTAFIGENGGGKTTLLRAFALAIIGLGSKKIDTTHPKIQRLFRIIATDEEGIRYDYGALGHIVIDYVYNDRVFDKGQETFIFLNQVRQPEYISFHDQISREGFGISQLDGDGDEELKYLVVGYPQRYGTTKSQPDFKQQFSRPSVFDVLPLIFDQEDQRMTSLRRWISEQWNAGDSNRQKVKDLFSVVSLILERDHQKTSEIAVTSAVSEDKIIVRTPQQSQGIYFDLLSTGLQNLFGWLGHLISRFHEAYPDSEKPLHEPAIVFVDEIDNYLHPEVHAKLMPVLLDTFPKTQFIITSHSPVILAGMPNTDAKAYRVTDGNIFPIENFYGKRISDLLYHQFSLDDRPADFAVQDADEILKLVRQGNLDEARQKLDALEMKLGQDDPLVMDARHQIEAMDFA